MRPRIRGRGENWESITTVTMRVVTPRMQDDSWAAEHIIPLERAPSRIVQ
jgi:hypothetical protein